MTLENLAKIGRLRPHDPAPGEIARLLAAAERNLVDAANATVSVAGRYTCAYAAIMQCAQAALFANRYRPTTSEGGHHATMIQALVHTIGLEPARMRALDAIRRKRNVIDYSGDVPEEGELADSLACALALMGDLRTWMRANRPNVP